MRGRERRLDMKVGQLMTKDVITVAPDTPLRKVAELLATKGISGVPVVAGDELLGVVSEADIVTKEQGAPLLPKRRFRHRGGTNDRLAARTAADAMTSPAVTIEDYRSISGAAQLMGEHGVNRLPVVHNGRLVGILTRADLVRAFARPDTEIAAEIRDDVVERAFWQANDRIRITVADGEVVLRGVVDSKTTAEGIPPAVTRVPGVVSVRSELEWPAEA
jgi:CBS domain-containing protein